MASVSSTLIRRGTEMIPQWLGFSIAVITGLAFGLAILWVDYTCTQVIATLAAVEVSNQHTYLRLQRDSEDPTNPDYYDLNYDDSEGKPITSGLRSAIKHLRARGGLWSSFRGFRLYLAFEGFSTVMGFLAPAISLLPSVSRSFISSFLSHFVASMLCATWHMAWVHLVIAEKSPRSPYRRMLGLQHWPRIAPAAALYNMLTGATFSLRIAAVWIVASTVTNPARDYKQLLGALGITIITATFFLLVCVPARAVFIRVSASMLPEEDSPIVPFDRTFGGKVKAETVGGDRKLGLVDAWTTFEWAARIRFLKVILKALAIECALGVVGILLVMGELVLL
ncbi:hypothetical protein BDV12DRAFT_207022 [Aspergillus spectabilis]